MEAVNETNNQLQCKECRVVLIELKVEINRKNLTGENTKRE